MIMMPLNLSVKNSGSLSYFHLYSHVIKLSKLRSWWIFRQNFFIVDFYVLFLASSWNNQLGINQKSAVNANPNNHYVKYIIDNKVSMECVTISLVSGAHYKLVIYYSFFIFTANLLEISRVYIFHLSLNIINFMISSWPHFWNFKKIFSSNFDFNLWIGAFIDKIRKIKFLKTLKGHRKIFNVP